MILILVIFSLVSGVNALFYHSSVLADDLTVQQMIDNAAPGSTVNLDSKIYSGDGNQNIVVDKDLTINGNGATIDAQKRNKIFQVNSGVTVIIKDVKLVNGNNTRDGGAIVNNGVLTLENIVFENNTAIENSLAKGGAIYNKDKLIVKSSNFIDSRVAYKGGAIYNDERCSVSVSNSQFSDNVANSSFDIENLYKEGGAIFCDQGSLLTVESSNFKNNFAEAGGAISTYFDSSVDVKSSNFTSNRAYKYNTEYNFDDGFGGAVYNLANFSVSGSNFTNNSATVDGGIANAGKDSVLDVSKSVFTDNSANSLWGSGAAIDNTGITTITDSKFNNNKATSNSGAVCNNNKMTIIRSEFNGNSADNGGAIKNQNFGSIVAELNVFDSQFNDNVAGSGGAIYNDAILNIVGSNLTDNKATTGGYYYGGGGAIKNLGTLTINSSNFNNNQAKNNVNSDEVNRGGAIATSNDTEITNSKFIANKADSVNSRGGGDGSGGAIKTWNKCKFLVKDSTFDGNSASYRGGAIDFDDSISREGRSTDAVTQGTNLDANLVNVDFNNNNAKVGGAVELCNGVLSATGVKFTGNSASVQGGALDIRGVDYDSSFNILDVNGKHFSDFFTGNSAGLGKSVLIYMGQYLNPDFICDEGVQSGEISKDYYSTWK